MSGRRHGHGDGHGHGHAGDGAPDDDVGAAGLGNGVGDERDAAWLEALGAEARAADAALAARERAAWLPYEALVRGELSDAALRRLLEADPTGERAWRAEALAPLDDAAHARAVRAVLAASAPDESRAEAAGGVGFDDRPAAPPRRARRWTVTARSAAAVGVALAATALLVVWNEPPAAPLPAYAMELSPGVRTTRGSDPQDADAPSSLDVPSFLPDTRFELVVRPARRVEGAVEVTPFLRTMGGARVRWDPPVERSPLGALRIAGTTRALFEGRVGRVRVGVEIRRPGASAPGVVLERTVMLEQPVPEQPALERTVIGPSDAGGSAAP